MSDLEQRLDKLRNILLSDQFDRKKKVRVLGRVMELRHEPEVCALIRQATRADVNQEMLSYFVRVLGYLEDPGVLDDLAEYIVHPRKLVARNAVKAAVSYDPERAVEMVMKVVRTAPLKSISAAVKVLAERCPREAAPSIEKLMGSRSRRDRLVAVMFLTDAADLEAAGRLIEMLRHEAEPAIVDLLFRALEQQSTQAHQTLIDQLRTELWSKGERLRELASRLPAEPMRQEAPRSESRKMFPLPPLEPPAGAAPSPDDSRPELLRASGPVPRPPVPRPPVSRPVAISRSADYDPKALLPWQQKEAKLKAKRSKKDRSGTLFRPRLPEKSLQGLAVLLVILGIGGSVWLSGLSVGAPPKQLGTRTVEDLAASPLGRVNAKVKIDGRIAEVHADYNTMLVRAKDGTLASVRFADSIASFSAGRMVQIEGTIREVRAGGVCVVDGTTAREP